MIMSRVFTTWGPEKQSEGIRRSEVVTKFMHYFFVYKISHSRVSTEKNEEKNIVTKNNTVMKKSGIQKVSERR